MIGADRIFQRIGTNVRPSQPTLALATTGMFTWTRNPMYVGGSLALLGIAIGFALDWVYLLLVVSLPFVHYGIILREERYLERKLGDEYRRYKMKVPRYWWRFETGSHNINAPYQFEILGTPIDFRRVRMADEARMGGR